MDRLLKDYQYIADPKRKGSRRPHITYHSSMFWTKIQATEILRKLANELGRTPKKADLKSNILNIPIPPYSVYEKYFGNWTNALKSIGLDRSVGRKPKSEN